MSVSIAIVKYARVPYDRLSPIFLHHLARSSEGAVQEHVLHICWNTCW